MAEIRRFEDRLDEIETIAEYPDECKAAAQAARYFSKALDALQTEFEPHSAKYDIRNIYYTLVHDYLLEAAADLEGFIDDDDTAC